MRKNPPVRFWKAIKLVHSDDLRRWDRFPKYQQHVGLNYFEYQKEADRILKIKHQFPVVVKAWERLLELDRGDMKLYKDFNVDISSALGRGVKCVTLPKPEHENTAITVSDGRVEHGVLSVKSGSRTRRVRVTYSCPSRNLHAEEIESLLTTRSGMNATEQQVLKEIRNSRFTHPVLFVSHRWETLEHPDPRAAQLEKLRELESCFIIYDYSSFPQTPLSGREAANFRLIMDHMGELVGNVVILNSPGYATRGWCIYEYIASSLDLTVICDEIQKPEFVSLRNWKATMVPFPKYLFRNSYESMQQNYLNEAILSTVNEILPLYEKAMFSVEQDRAIVDKLLITNLKRNLPPKKHPVPYIGDWQTVRWMDEELADAFKHELRWEPLDTLPIDQYNVNIPQTIGEAVRRGYKIDVPMFDLATLSWKTLPVCPGTRLQRM